MDNAVITTIVSTGGSVIVGLGGMWIATNSLGARIGDIVKRMDRLEDKIGRVEDQLAAFKDVVNGKLSALDLEIAKLLDKNK